MQYIFMKYGMKCNKILKLVSKALFCFDLIVYRQRYENVSEWLKMRLWGLYVILHNIDNNP